MSLITKIEVQKNDDTRANIYVDDKFYAGVSIELIVKNHLKKGLEIENQLLDDIIIEDEKSSALSKALKYSSSNLKTKKQIRDYLKKKEYNSQTIEYVIEKMSEYNYLDDEAYAKAYLLTYSKKYGKLRLINDLKNRGISETIIDNLFADDFEINNSIEEVANKYLKNKEVNEQTLIKLNRFLYSRGYEFEDISKLLSEIRRNKWE